METIEGIIVPAVWDKDGKVTGIKILGYDEDQFEITDNQLGQMLLVHLRQAVTVSGKILNSEDKKQITVENFVLHENNPI